VSQWSRRSWCIATQHITQEYSYISETFLGLIIIPIIGNAAEHATAVVVARKGQIDLALQIAQGSSTQVALLIAPVLVFLGLVLVPSGTGQYMNLVFAPLQVVAVFWLRCFRRSSRWMENRIGSKGCSCSRCTP
jgi:calcium/proton exchanger cax